MLSGDATGNFDIFDAISGFQCPESGLTSFVLVFPFSKTKCKFGYKSIFMARILFLFTYLFSAINTNAQELLFARQTTGGEHAKMHCMATDSEGNVYYGGNFYNTTDFDPLTPAGLLTASSSTGDGFLAKYDSSGALLWCFKVGGSGLDFVKDVAVDDSGNVAITGHFSDYVNFDPLDSITWVYGGSSDMFVAKYEPNGHLIWVYAPTYTTSPGAYGSAVAFDHAGNLICTGYYDNIINLNPQGWQTVGMDTAVNYLDIYVVKYSPMGQYQWSFSLGTDNLDDVTWEVLVDDNNNIYLGGYSDSPLTDFDPGAGTAFLGGAGREYFVAKYGSNGNFLWLAGPGNTGLPSETQSMSLDNYGHLNAGIYIMGGAPLDVDISTDLLIFDIKSIGDPVILQFDKNTGNLLRGIQIEDTTSGGGISYPRSLVTDSHGSIYVSGNMQSNGMDFDPGPGSAIKNSISSCDAFVAKYDSAYNYQWVVNLGGPTGANGAGYALTTDLVDNLYMAGIFCGRADFDPGPDTLFLGITYQLGYTRFISKWGTQLQPVGINEVISSVNGLIYPDPANNFIHLKSDENSLGDICIYTLSGNLVKKLSASLNNAIPVYDLEEGMYICKAINLRDNSAIYSRFVISR